MLILYCQFLGAQAFDKLGADDGFSSSFVLDILQAKDGFMYFALKHGINRFDGKSIKKFSHNAFDPYSLSPQAVDILAEDQRGYIWVGMLNGTLDVFNPKTQKFYHFGKLGDNLVELNQFIIRDIIADPNDDIWISLENDEVFKLKIPEDFDLDLMPADNSYEALVEYHFKFEHISSDSSRTKRKGGLSFFLDSRDQLWASSRDEQLLLIDWVDNKYQLKLTAKGGIRKDFVSLVEDKNRRIWFDTGDQWHCVSDNGIKTFDLSPAYSDFGLIGSDNKGQLISRLRSRDSTYILSCEPEFDSIEDLDYKELFSYKGRVGRNFLIDQSQTYWLTAQSGLMKFHSSNGIFEESLSGRSIYEFYEDLQHNIFTKHKGVIYHFNEERDELEPFSKIYGGVENPKNILFNTDSTIFGMNRFFQRKGPLKKQNNFFAYDINAKQYESCDLKPLQESFNVQFIGDQDNLIWIANEKGELYSFRIKDQKLTKYADQTLSEKIGHSFYLNAIYLDISNRVWLCTNKGLIKTNSNDFPNAKPKFELIENDPKNAKSINSNYIKCILEDPLEPEKYMWAGTDGNGFSKINVETYDCISYHTENSKLPDDVVYGIQSDDNGNLWLSTNQGLSRFNIRTEVFKNFSIEDGLQNMEFNSNSTFKSKDGMLYFGGIEGVNIFQPESLAFNESVPTIKITNLEVNNTKLSPKERRNDIILGEAIEYTEKIELKHYHNAVTIQFASLDFANPTKNHYKYKLTKKGLFADDSKMDWISLENENRVQFSNLNAGTYLLQVHGTNNHGKWSETPASLEIKIKPIWWKTNLAYITYLLLCSGMVWWLYQNQIKKQKLKTQVEFEQKEAQRLAEVDKIKTDFFSNITHEFRTPLTLILEPIRQLLNEDIKDNILQKLKLVSSNSERLLLLVNQLLDISKIEAKKMTLDLRKGNIHDVIEPIFDSFRVLSEAKNIDLQLTYLDEIPAFVFDRGVIEKITYNLLSNAIKFTNEGAVAMELSVIKGGENKLQIIVKDTGIGIPKNQLAKVFDRFHQINDVSNKKESGTGIGLALTQEFITLIGGSIDLQSEINKGSTFRIRIPMDLKINTSSNGEYESTFLPGWHESFSPEIADQNQEGEKKLILLVEDNPELRAFLNMSLSPYYTIKEAYDGADGIQKAKEMIPDLIISDLMMPKKNGNQLCRELKENKLTSHIPIIILTAKSAIESKLEGLATGADDYLTKPFNTKELLVRISNLIELRKRMQANFGSKLLQEAEHKQDLETEISPLDAEFLNQIKSSVEEHISNFDFGVENLAQSVFMSRSQLFRKMKALIGQTPNEFIRNYRLEKSMVLLKAENLKVYQVAEQVGFADEKYFAKRFKAKFKMSPSEVRT